MTCGTMRLPGGTAAIVCTRGRRRRLNCGVTGCSGEARWQCDFAVGAGQTCDRWLCERHRVPGPDPDIDFCPQHARQLDLVLAEDG